MGGRAVEGSGLLNRRTPYRGSMGSNPIPSANPRSNFKASLNVGENGERMLWAWLYGQYGDDLRHISEYSPGKYRDSDGLRLPDFFVKREPPIYIESKMKVGWHGRLNLDVAQVKDYLRVAQKINAEFLLYFICTEDCKMYRLNEFDLKNYSRIETDRRGKQFFLYEKEDLEIVFNKVPRAIFNTDALYG